MCNPYKYTDCRDLVYLYPPPCKTAYIQRVRSSSILLYVLRTYICNYPWSSSIRVRSLLQFHQRPRWGQSQYRWRRRASVRLGIQHDRARASLGSTLTNPFWRSSLSITWYLLGYFSLVCWPNTKWKYHLMLTHPLSCGGSNGLTQGGILAHAPVAL